MSLLLILGVLLLLGGAAFLAGRARATGFVKKGGRIGAVHSLPGYHGSYVAALALAPALLLLAAWGVASEGIVERAVLAEVPVAAPPVVRTIAVLAADAAGVEVAVKPPAAVMEVTVPKK
jgi:phosphate transport system permease protein